MSEKMKMTATGIECGAESESTQDKPVNKNGGSRDGDDDGGWHDRSDHPLLNNVVLSKVFERVKPRDLKACRGVCKIWNTSTIPFTRSKWIVRIYGNPLNRLPTSMQILRGFGEESKGQETHRVEHFIQLFSKNQLGIPFGRFRLESFRMTDGVGQEFVKLCGDIALYIDLSNNDRYDVEDVSELLKSVPNLVKFHIPRSLRSRSGNVVKLFPDDNPNPKLSSMKNLKSTFDYPEERNKCCPTFVEELLTASKNISHLAMKFSHINSDDNVTKCTSFEALTAIEKLSRESSIQSLKFSYLDSQPEIELLNRMQSKGMKLKRLSTTLCVRNPLHIQMAALFKDTLEHYSPVLCTSFMGFPTVPRLKLLELVTVKKFDSGCTNLDKMFPALEELKIQPFDYEIYDEFFPESQPCPKMKSFIVGDACMRLTSFTQMRAVFPNLTVLHLDVYYDGLEILRSIWSGMSQLEVLKLRGTIRTTDNENLDSIFTGLTIAQLEENENLVKGLDKITNKELKTKTIEEIINGTSQDRPSIRNLSNLSHLNLSVVGQGNCEEDDDDEDEATNTFLTQMTGYLSFYSMKHVSHLTIEECQFTKSCCEVLAKDMGLQSWKFWTSEDVDIIPEMKAD